MADTNRIDDFLIQQQAYRENAFNLILKMLTFCETNETKPLMDEMLHSIFFLAKICPVPFKPQEIIPDNEMYQALMKKYPKPVEHLSQLPKRTPFSSVLDMVVLKEKPENEARVKESLRAIAISLEATFPVSSTICISQKSNDPKATRYYGVSMSTTGPNPRGIMIPASCCGPWDNYVAGAVMTFLSNKKKKKDTPKFEGAIKLPKSVRCDAFEISTGKKKDPCRSCGNMFGLPTNESKEWPYGNCAEAESVSNLLKHESEVKRNVVIPSPLGTDEIRGRVQRDVRDKLQEVLRNTPYHIRWNGDFYTA